MKILVAAGMICLGAVAQTFEVASVKASPPPDGRGMTVRRVGGPGSKDPGRLMLENFALSGIVEMAYEIQDYQLSAPAWINSTRFTVTAKVPEGATREQLHVMLQKLLIERFKLEAHREKKDVSGYQLVVARNGPKMKESPGALDEEEMKGGGGGAGKMTFDKEGFPELPPGRTGMQMMAKGMARWRLADETMSNFADGLAAQLRGPVIDATGLKGKYDFTISWSAMAMRPDPPDDAGPSLFDAVQGLGLKLERTKVPVEMVVVDKIEKTPTEN